MLTPADLWPLLRKLVSSMITTAPGSPRRSRTVLSRLLGELPAILALNSTDNPFQVSQRPAAGLRARKTRGDAGMETFEFLPPFPHFDKGGFRTSRDDRLRRFHRPL